jgi:hypothetical protein
MKNYILSDEQKDKDYEFVKLFTKQMVVAHESGIRLQICEFLKILLDNESLERRNEFFEVFYEHGLCMFTEFLQSPSESDDMAFSKQLIIEIFTKCAKDHGYRMRAFTIQ